MSVVLPAPFGPSRPKSSPRGTDSVTPLSATRSFNASLLFRRAL